MILLKRLFDHAKDSRCLYCTDEQNEGISVAPAEEEFAIFMLTFAFPSLEGYFILYRKLIGGKESGKNQIEETNHRRDFCCDQERTVYCTCRLPWAYG